MTKKKFDKQKILSILSSLGLIYIIFIVVSFFTMDKSNEIVVLDQPQSTITAPNNLAGASSPSPQARMKKGVKHKEMRDARFLAPDGTRTRWRDFQGNYLLVNIWATWCPPCVVELPSLTKLQEHYKGRGLEVIAISVDTQVSHDQLKAFLYDRKIGQFAAYMDDNMEIQARIKTRGLPTTYLLDPQGKVIHIFEGDADWFSPHATDFFTSLLNKEN